MKRQAKKVSTSKKKGAKKPDKFMEEWRAKLDRFKWLRSNIPRLEDTLTKLREIRAPKVIVDNEARLIKKYKAEYKALDADLHSYDEAAKRLLRAIFCPDDEET